jgi:hypothetical protein
MTRNEPSVKLIPAVPMTVNSLMKRPLMTEIQDYESEIRPLLPVWGAYKQGFEQLLSTVPGTFYAVANFHLKNVKQDWCRTRLNLFDMKIAHCLLGKNWCKRPNRERTHWIAVPEMATFLHYNMIWDVVEGQQEKFFLSAPEVWRDIVPSGQFHLEVIGDEKSDHTATRLYSAKTFSPRWTIDGTVTSMELRRK